jgi:quercetin dioxygenase-like cupin family protein
MDTTSGTEEREPRFLREPLMRFELQAEVERLAAEPQWNEGDRNSIVLEKDARLRVLLTALRSGVIVGEDHVDGPMTIQVLTGAVVVGRGNRTLELAEGDLATIEPGAAAWSVKALDDSAVLITIAWPPERTRA